MVGGPGSGGLAWAEFVGCAVGSGDVDFAGGVVKPEGPVSFVGEDVVVAAEQDEFVDVGLAAEVPGQFGVVGVGPRKWHVYRICHWAALLLVRIAGPVA
jgi:hypothetical protein